MNILNKIDSFLVKKTGFCLFYILCELMFLLGLIILISCILLSVSILYSWIYLLGISLIVLSVPIDYLAEYQQKRIINKIMDNNYENAHLPEDKKDLINRIKTLQSGYELDKLVAEYVYKEPKPEKDNDNSHIPFGDYYSVRSPKKAWYGRYEYEEGDTGEWTPIPFSSEIRFANELFNFLLSNKIGYKISYSSFDETFVNLDGVCITAPCGYKNFPVTISKAAVILAIMNGEK